ncbi:MAG TPA: hypothetical protein VFK02_25700 [Kofleriaceae bacterium]|nr:hypothetical protein [Kofleriaceae bacterium]
MTFADRPWLGWLASIATVGVTVGVCSPAHAQSARAEVLFQEGRNLIKRGKLAAGCDKLAASEQLESSVGTLLNLGDCREKLGKLASAWAAFRRAEALARRTGGDEKRQAEAGKRAAQLEPRVPTLTIEVPRRVDGLIVHRDAEIVDEAQWSTALPVDPGSYTIAAEAPGYQAWQTNVVIGPVVAGAATGAAPDVRHPVVTVPLLERAPAVREPEPVGNVEPGPERPAAPAMILHRGGMWSGTRKLSVVLGVAGAAALGTGVYFGVHSRDLRDRADERCPLTVCADSEALRLNDQAQTAARRANVLYIAGGATLATALVLWLVGAPDETIVVPTAGDHRAGVAMTGRF